MSYEELKKNGTKVDEYDNYDGAIYLGTTEYWVNKGYLYVHNYHSNLNRYTGKTSTDIVAKVSDLEEYNDDYFLHVVRLSKEGLEKFKECARL